MTQGFDDAALTGVLRHMNGDHAEDNLLIVRAFSPESEVIAATMIGFDGDGGDWRAQPLTGDEFVVRVPWPGGPITERAGGAARDRGPLRRVVPQARHPTSPARVGDS